MNSRDSNYKAATESGIVLYCRLQDAPPVLPEAFPSGRVRFLPPSVHGHHRPYRPSCVSLHDQLKLLCPAFDFSFPIQISFDG